MQKLFFLPVLFNAIVLCAHAQPAELMIKSGSKGLYLDHEVAPKEGLYAIGRLYNVNPTFMAEYNKIELTGLAIGQVIHIPLTDTNFTQQSNKGVPVYYIAQENEGLLKVSHTNNKVTMQKLRDWNELQGDTIAAGKKIIVGFLMSTEMAAFANQELAVAAVTEQGYFKTSFDQQVKINPVLKNETVTAGIFKTTSGWQDAKYYLLINDVATGTIVKISNPENNKTVYAKVLGEMNGIRHNQGLDIRISNAACAALGVLDTEKFILKVNY